MQTPLLATTKRRRSRITPRQARALAQGSDHLLNLRTDPLRLEPPLESRFAPDTPLIVDIGFGTGEPVEHLARAEPERGIIAIDVHTPGIGDLLHRIESIPLTNVVVVEADARIVLSCLREGSLTGVRTFFPDPWPKKRHHRRRLVSADVTAEVASRLGAGGFWHLATDWPDYAQQMLEVILANGSFAGGVIDRPEARPLTRYERYAHEAGRESIDLWFERIGS